MNTFTRFGQIFWGLLLVTLDLKFSGFDVLPDFIGYILVAVGCSGLVCLSRHFSTAQTLSWVLLVLSLVGFVFRVIPNIIASLYSVAQLAADCGMIWFLLDGIMEFATASERPDLAQRASNRRVAYVVLMCTGTLIMWVALYLGHATTLILVAYTYAICIISLMVVILHLIHRVKHELAAH